MALLVAVGNSPGGGSTVGCVRHLLVERDKLCVQVQSNNGRQPPAATRQRPASPMIARELSPTQPAALPMLSLSTCVCVHARSCALCTAIQLYPAGQAIGAHSNLVATLLIELV